MSEINVYTLSGLTIVAYMFLPLLWFYIISIPILIVLLFVLANNIKKMEKGISPYLLSGVGTLFGLTAIFFNFTSIPAVPLAIFFLLCSIIKVFYKKEGASTKKLDLTFNQTYPSQKNKELDLKEEILIELGKKMDNSLSEINSALRRMENKAQPIAENNDMFEKLREGLTNEMISFLTIHQEQLDNNRNLLNKMIEDELQMVKHSMGKLVDTMKQTNTTQEKIQATLNIVKEKSQNIPTIDLIREAILETMRQNSNSSESIHIQNHEIKNYFYRALEEAKTEVCIISPWISKWVLQDSDIFIRFESLLKRGVNLRILYGIEGSSSKSKNDNKNDITEKVATELKNKLSKKKYPGRFQIGKINSHYKLFICDDEYYVQSSMNILSNKGDYGEGFTWHEAGQYSTDKQMLKTIKNLYFGSDGQYSKLSS